MTKIGIAQIGAGTIGAMRAAILRNHPAAYLTGLADPDMAAARRAAAGATVASDYRQLLEDPKTQAVIVSTPLPLHEVQVREALQAGKHVLCEKPLAATPGVCAQLRQLAQQQGLQLCLGFNHRFYPCIQELRRVLPQLGELHHVRALAGHRGVSEFRADWMYRSQLSGGGAMMDIGIHLTDLVHHLFGPIEKVYAQVSQRLWQVEGSEDHASGLLTTASGLPIAYHANWGEWKGYRLVLDVYGSHGLARAFYAPMLNLLVRRSQGRPWPRWNLHPKVNLREKFQGWETTARLAFRQEIDEFLKCLAGKPALLADAEAGWRATAVAHAAYLSQSSGQPVLLSDPRLL